jgi:hypothetical protein
MTVVAEAIGKAANDLKCHEGKIRPEVQARVSIPVVCWPHRRDDLVLLLVTQGYWESKYAKFVHDGTCNRKKTAPSCDSKRAASVWQIQSSRQVTRLTWQRMIGTQQEATNMAAFTAGRLLALARQSCGSVVGAISMYGTGRHCAWKGAKPRERFWWKLRQAQK